MSEENKDELELQAGDKKIRIRGSDILGMINMLAIGVMLYGGFQHVDAAKESNKTIADAIKESVQTQRQMVQAQQEANCLNRLTPVQKMRPDEIEFCRNIGRGR